MRFAVCTLGCKVNQYESQALEHEGVRRGHTLVDFDQEAEVYLINTCTVTAIGDQKNRQIIRRVRREHPDAVVVVCGCYPQTHPGQVETLGADLVAGTGERALLWDRLEGRLAAPQAAPAVFLDDAMARRSFERLPAGGLSGRTRAMLKVEDGCCNFCSYCIIPYARGPVRSLPLDEAVEQARSLAQQGFLELVLTGIELSSWGHDLPGRPPLHTLVGAVCEALPQLRIRLGSLEPRTVTDEFCAALARYPNLCPHFHLSLQSGCAKTLRAMNRKYDPARYLQSVELLRAHFDRPAIATDLIVGFPGEGEAEFQESLAFVAQCAFSGMHIFPYSRRPGTPADAMPAQVAGPEKHRRVALATELARTLQRRYLDALVGHVLEVLFEEEKDALWVGHAPNYVQVRAAGQGLHNRVCPVRITAVEDEHLLGVIEG